MWIVDGRSAPATLAHKSGSRSKEFKRKLVAIDKTRNRPRKKYGKDLDEIMFQLDEMNDFTTSIPNLEDGNCVRPYKKTQIGTVCNTSPINTVMMRFFNSGTYSDEQRSSPPLT